MGWKKRNLLFAYQYVEHKENFENSSSPSEAVCVCVWVSQLGVCEFWLPFCCIVPGIVVSIHWSHRNEWFWSCALQGRQNQMTTLTYVCVCVCTKKNCMFVCIQIKSIWLKKTMQAQYAMRDGKAANNNSKWHFCFIFATFCCWISEQRRLLRK